MDVLSGGGGTDAVGICNGIVETIVAKTLWYYDSKGIDIVRRSDDIGMDDGTAVDVPGNR